jgi:flavodoxin
MKALIVYDSQFGNTGKIAQAIADGLGTAEEVGLKHVGEIRPEQLTELALLILGSPTQRFRPTPGMTDFLKRIPANSLKGVHVAAFDTRFTEEKIGEIQILAFFVGIFGYAAKPIGDRLAKMGGKLAAPPEGFYVDDTEGPLLEGELERATEWGKQIAAALERA